MAMHQAIDVHAHYVPPGCMELLERGPETANFIGDMTDLDRRFTDMDKMQVDFQVLSAWQGFFNQSPSTARKFNDGMAATVAAHPDKFAGMAVVPFGDPEEAVAELLRAVNDLGLCGVEIGSNVKGHNLDDPAFRPFFAKAEELDVPIFIHPTNPLGKERLKKYELVNLVGFLADTTVAAASLVFGGVLQDFPQLKVQLAHGGGVMPFLRGRWEHGWKARQFESAISSAPTTYLKQFYADSIAHSSESLSMTIDFLGADQVMIGTDYPYDMGDPSPRSTLDALTHLDDDQRAAILGGNAKRIFRL